MQPDRHAIDQFWQVVLNGSLTPSDFSPGALARAGVLDTDEALDAQVDVLDEDRAEIRIGRLALQVDEDKILLSTGEDEDADINGLQQAAMACAEAWSEQLDGGICFLRSMHFGPGTWIEVAPAAGRVAPFPTRVVDFAQLDMVFEDGSTLLLEESNRVEGGTYIAAMSGAWPSEMVGGDWREPYAELEPYIDAAKSLFGASRK
jgi:hypothetical protein